MKWIKRILGTIITIIFLLFTVALFIYFIDHKRTGYLRIKQHPGLQQKDYLIKNVHVIPMYSDTVLYNKTVLIHDGIIVSVNDKIPDGNTAPVIDGGNRFLCPGLTDMHVHVWDAQAFGLYLANGVTAVRNMWGIPYHLRLKKELETGYLIGPKFIVSTPKLTGPKDYGVDKIQLESPQEAAALVAKYHRQGYDIIKTYAGLPKPIYDVIVEQAVALNMPIASHPSFEVPYAYHFQKGFESVEHTEDVVQQGLKFKLDSTGIDSVIALYLKGGISHTPTLSIFQNIIDILEQGEKIKQSREAGYMNPTFVRLGSADDYNRWITEQEYDPGILQRIKKQHGFHLFIIKKMHEAGVKLICGTDAGILYAPPGFSTHEELAYYVQAGLTPFEALQTATVNPAKTTKLLANTGSIEPGKTANLILAESNPLQDLSTLRKPTAVWVNGVMIDSGRIDQFKYEGYKRKTMGVTFLRLLESLW